MQALTKYQSGGADVLMGAVITRDEALHERLALAHMRLGLGVGANDAELVLRALPTLELRYDAQDAAARALAQWLAQQPRGHAACCIRPFRASPGHEHWKALCTQAAGLFSVVFDARHRRAQRRHLRRCAAAVPHRLFVGRAGQPGGAVRPEVAARAAALAAARSCGSRSASRRRKTCRRDSATRRWKASGLA